MRKESFRISSFSVGRTLIDCHFSSSILIFSIFFNSFLFAFNFIFPSPIFPRQPKRVQIYNDKIGKSDRIFYLKDTCTRVHYHYHQVIRLASILTNSKPLLPLSLSPSTSISHRILLSVSDEESDIYVFPRQLTTPLVKSQLVLPRLIQ